MSRYITPPAVDVPRKKTIKLFASNPSVAVPAWAGVVYVTGCGAGAGGSNSTVAGQRGAGGIAGAYAIRAPIPLDGEAVISVVIGAPGGGAAGSSNTLGGVGGSTVITVGGRALTLSTRAHFGSIASITSSVDSRPWTPTLVNQAGTNWDNPLAPGAVGGLGSSGPEGMGAGGFGPFGGGGDGVANPPAANAPGADATGFGAGGAGSNGTGKAGDGSPGFVMLEFEETA